MAEKKFFVDINLQGSALKNAKIGTNSGIGSTEGAFGFDSASHRLQYFDGTATKDVANLSDISAVTGGLIFQGGYDPTTDTPDITDGSALKGFLWVATAAGTFLGESVQVGDSIVAKVDAAGATIADWLILQGNIVIATDSVDGISRLATQTEANAGTEGGAVVITPATLQGKIDAQITPEISNKLPLAGGTMSGNLDMANSSISNVNVLSVDNLSVSDLHNDEGDISVSSNLNIAGFKITNLPAPTDGGDAANKTYVDSGISDKLSLFGGTMFGNIDMAGEPITGLQAPTQGDHAANKTYVDDQDALKLSLTGGSLTGNLDMNYNSVSNAVLSNGSLGNEFNAVNNKITNLGTPTGDGDAANKQYVDTAASTAQANAEATASADASEKANAAETDAKQYADSLAPNYDAAGSAAQALTDANAYTDTGLAAKLSLTGGTMSGAINMDNNDLTNVRTLYTSSEGSLGSPYLNTDHIGQYNGSDVKLSSDINAQNTQKIINLPAPTADGDAANKTYVDDNTSNKLPLAGGTMSGNINMGDNDVITGNGAFRGDGLEINNVYSKNGTTVFINTDLSLQNNSIKNLPAPTADGDATNKLYVDGAAATAESNANDYTDTEIAAQKAEGVILSSDWVFDNVENYFIKELTTSLTGKYLNATFYNNGGNETPAYGGEVIELFFQNSGSGYHVVISNINPGNVGYIISQA